jgi:hypothetical protein
VAAPSLFFAFIPEREARKKRRSVAAPSWVFAFVPEREAREQAVIPMAARVCFLRSSLNAKQGKAAIRGRTELGFCVHP